MSPSTNDYAGDIDCRGAFERLRADPGAQLIDVRTMAEWTYVGVPDIGTLGKRALFVEWQQFPAGTVNPEFVAQADAALARAGAPAGGALLMLCRSGGRSAAAAMALTAAGYGPAYNILGGFEGDLDEHRQRGRRNGWKAAGLPWQQG